MNRQPWYLSNRFRIIAVVVLASAAVIEGVIAIFFRENDFVWHFESGEAFLRGEPLGRLYNGYTLGRLMLNGMLASLGYTAARAACYLLGLASLAGAIVLWAKMTGDSQSTEPVSRTPEHSARSRTRAHLLFAAAVISLAVLYPYVIRDLDDCGLQTMLLFMITAGAYCVVRQRNASAGFWLGLAATYKTLPIVFLPFLVWKRNWKAACWMSVFFVALNLSPALVVGWETTMEAHGRWLAVMRANSRLRNPSEVSFEPPRHQNQSLRMAVARFTMTFPESHPLHVKHPLFVQFGSLSPAAAHWATTAVLFVVSMVLAARFWGSTLAKGQSVDVARQFAAVAAWCAILSPLCWLQHLVLIVPCVFLGVHDVLTADLGRWQRRWRLGVLSAIAFIVLILQRDVVGRELSIIVLSYKLDTLVALLSMFLALATPKARAVAAVATPETDSNSPRLAA